MRALWATAWALTGVLIAAAVALAAFVTATAGEGTTAWIIGAAGALVVAGVVATGIARVTVDYRNYRYEVTEHGLYVARGWLWRSWQIVPHSRVQTVDTSAGPLHRLFGLVTVQVTTASASGATAIPGLTQPAAAALLDELARRAELEEGT